jgi:hypothetical protein
MNGLRKPATSVVGPARIPSQARNPIHVWNPVHVRNPIHARKKRGLSRRASRRPGLSSLELVLSIPLMLMAMMLMMHVGWLGVWKLRSHTAAREVLWNNRVDPHRREARLDPPPPEWPAGQNSRVVEGRLSRSRGTPRGRFDDFINDQPELHYEFIHGPAVHASRSSPNPNEVIRLYSDRMFEFGHAFITSTASVRRRPPAWSRLRAYRFRSEQMNFDGTWQFADWDYALHGVRRTFRWYNFETHPSWDQLTARFVEADAALRGSRGRAGVRLLDRDEELRAFFAAYTDFYPGVPGVCTLDELAFARGPLQTLLRGVRSVPRRMADSHLQMYRQMADEEEQGRPRPNSPGLARLRQYISELEQFIRTAGL